MVMFSKSKDKWELKRQPMMYLTVSGALKTVAMLTRSISLIMAPVVFVTPFASLSPLFTVFFSYLLIQRMETINRYVVLGATTAVAGAVLIALFT
jgi:drug/metabolite transporter (DMT)-like permease